MNSQPTTSSLDVYQLVTDQIIALLKQGVIPWQQNWTDAGIPMNLLSKRHYRGINLWLLLSLNYEKNLFLTWDQIKSLGASVNRDEKGHIVVFWKMIQKHKEESPESQKLIPILRYYKVFNVAQCRNIPQQFIPEDKESIDKCDSILECEDIITKMGDCPRIIHEEQKAFYRPDIDIINMPRKESFTSVEGYYSTLYHELVHSTGSEKRLGRKSVSQVAPFGSHTYAMEELIAEMGSSYLCQFSSILPNQIENIVAYLQNWLAVFESDKRFLITASGQAQKAVDFILGTSQNESKDDLGSEPR